jgi:hypothetical protein
MANLKTVLRDSSERFLKGGGGAGATVRKALRAHRQHQNLILGVLAILLLCATAATGYQLMAGSPQWRQLAGLAGVGVGGGALEGLRRIWKDWSRTELLLILLEDAGEAEIASIVKKLITRL